MYPSEFDIVAADRRYRGKPMRGAKEIERDVRRGAETGRRAPGGRDVYQSLLGPSYR